MNQFDFIGEVLNRTLKEGKLPPEYKTQELKKTSEPRSTRPPEFYSDLKSISSCLEILNISSEKLSKNSLKSAVYEALKNAHPDTNQELKNDYLKSAEKISQIKTAEKNISNFIEKYGIN